MDCKWTLGEKYIKIKLQTAWENAFQVPHKDFTPISKASPREHVTDFMLDLADAGTGLCFLQYQYLHYGLEWCETQDLQWEQGKWYHLEGKINNIVTTKKLGSQSCVGWVLSLFGFRELCDFILWLKSCFCSICVTQKSWICIRPSMFQERIFCSVMWTH